MTGSCGTPTCGIFRRRIPETREENKERTISGKLILNWIVFCVFSPQVYWGVIDKIIKYLKISSMYTHETIPPSS